jgi:hypothetical protein
MTYFLKLNMVSMLYALVLLVPVELMLNVYRISRLMNWEIETVNLVSSLVLIIEFIGSTILLFFLTKNWLGGRKANYWSVVLWAPYFALFVYLLAVIMPITYGGDDPNPATGLLAIGGLMVYPFYILFLNFVGTTGNDKDEVSNPL